MVYYSGTFYESTCASRLVHPTAGHISQRSQDGVKEYLVQFVCQIGFENKNYILKNNFLHTAFQDLVLHTFFEASQSGSQGPLKTSDNIFGVRFSFFLLENFVKESGNKFFKINPVWYLLFICHVSRMILIVVVIYIVFSFIALIKHNYPSRDFDKVWESCISSINQLVLDITNRRTASYENDF